MTNNQEKILSLLVKKLDLSKNIEKSLEEILFSAHLVNYQNIKLLSRIIKIHLSNYNINTKQTHVLNIVSQALGYQNHHSLKSRLEVQTNQSNIKEDDSQLMRFYKVNKSFMLNFDFDEYNISYYINKSFMEFDIIYQKYGSNPRTKKGREITSWLKQNGIKPYKNTIPLFKIKLQNLQQVAFNIIQNYRNFFTPVWIEKNNNLKNGVAILDSWSIVAYSDISYEAGDFLIVDLYSTDLPWSIVTNFIDYILKFGTTEDVHFLEQCLKSKEFTKVARKSINLEEVVRLNAWQKDKLNQNIKVSFGSRKQVKFLEIKNYQIIVKDYMIYIIKKFERILSMKIQEAITQSCIVLFNQKAKITIETIYENLFNLLEIEQLNKKEYETIMRLSYETYLILDCLKNRYNKYKQDV